MTEKPRIVFMGTPDFSVPSLKALIDHGYRVVGVVTQPDRPRGRKRELTPPPVKRAAEGRGIPVFQPEKLRDPEAIRTVLAMEPDLVVTAAYGQIVPQAILDGPRHGCINIHASLLPRWRGAAPVQRAIMAGDEWTGVTLMQMEAGLDTGPMLCAEQIQIGDSNAAELTDRLAILGSEMLVELLQDFDRYQPHPQPEEGVTYASKISKDEAGIDWSRTASELQRHVQGLAPFPGAWFGHEGERIKLLEAAIDEGSGEAGEVLDDALTIACGDGALRPLLLQRAGKGKMTPGELLRGFAIPKGTILS